MKWFGDVQSDSDVPALDPIAVSSQTPTNSSKATITTGEQSDLTGRSNLRFTQLRKLRRRHSPSGQFLTKLVGQRQMCRLTERTVAIENRQAKITVPTFSISRTTFTPQGGVKSVRGPEVSIRVRRERDATYLDGMQLRQDTTVRCRGNHLGANSGESFRENRGDSSIE